MAWIENLLGWGAGAAALVLAAAWLLWRRRRNAKPAYVPARARIEGGGIKRGLTPPEGAILLGRPLNVALTLVLFELLRKGFVKQITAWPLAVEVAEGFRTHGSGRSAQARGEQRRKAAQTLHKALHPYEEAILELLEEQPGIPVANIDYSIAIQPLVRYVAGRVGGYDLEETRAYYRLIVERAPREARSDGVLTFERQKVFDRNFGWVLLGEDFRAVLDTEDYSYAPVWLREGSRDVGKSGSQEVKQSGNREVETSRPQDIQTSRLLGLGKSFAEWAGEVMEAMQGAVAEEEIKLGLDKETDTTTVTLMNEIARATFYG